MTCRRSQVRVLYRAPRVCDILDVTDSFFVVSPRTGKADVENEIRRGAFYMRPRRFALPQADTGGYGIRPYIFCGGRSPFAEAVPRVELSPFVESEIRRGAFYMRPRKFALLQADTGGYGIRPYVFLWRAEAPRRGRCPAWSCLPLSETKFVGAHSICAHGGLSCRKRARADMESAPTFFVAGGGPPAEAVPRVELSPFVESKIRRGAFYMRPRRFALPQAGTGGYGIRPYVFL